MEREKTVEWIMVIPGEDKKVYCKYCKSEMRAYHSDLDYHTETHKHKCMVFEMQPTWKVLLGFGKYVSKFGKCYGTIKFQ